MAKKKKAAAKKPPTKKTAKPKAVPKKKPAKKKAAEAKHTEQAVPAYYQTLFDHAIDVVLAAYPLFARDVMQQTAFLKPDAIWFAIKQISGDCALIFERHGDGIVVVSSDDETRRCHYTFEQIAAMSREYEPLRVMVGALQCLAAGIAEKYPQLVGELVSLDLDKGVELVKRALYSGFPVFEFVDDEAGVTGLANFEGVTLDGNPDSSDPDKLVSWPLIVDLLLETEPRELALPIETTTAAAPAESVVDVQTINRDGQLAEAKSDDDTVSDSELLDEIEELERECAETEARLNGLRESVKETKKLYEGQCIDLRRKIRERHCDSERALLNPKKKETRAEEIASREATTPTEGIAGSDPAQQMEWQKLPTSELHLADVVPRLSKELAETIEAQYPTMGELVDLHQQGTGKGKGIRSIIGIGPKMADAMIELVDNWLAKVRDGWGQPAAGHEDFTGEAADADNEPTDVVTKAEEDQLAAPSDEYLEILWQGTRVDELQLKPALIRKLKATSLPTVAAIENRRAGGTPLAEFNGLNINEISDLAGELDAGRDWHHHVQRIKHELTSGARPYAVPLAGECEAFDDGLRAGLDDGSSLLAESRELVDDAELLILWMGGFVHGRSMPREAAA